MEEQYSIIIYQRAGSTVDWHSEEYYGPFTSPEEREAWLAIPENKLNDSRSRYIVQFLSK